MWTKHSEYEYPWANQDEIRCGQQKTKTRRNERCWPTFYPKSASKDNKQVHKKFYEKINKELNVTKNCTNQKTKKTFISTTRKNENEAKRNDNFECRKCKETCVELNERMN